MFQENVNGNKTRSQPFVTADGWVWFQGENNNHLLRVFNDGSKQSRPGGHSTSSTPFVTADGWVWFRATDNGLWKMRADGSQLSRPGNNSTSDQPVVTADGWVWFRGTNNHLLRMRTDGTQQSRPGNNSTSSTPFVTADGWVWFRATNDSLWRMRGDGSQLARPGNNSTSSTPFVTSDGWVWFRATNNSLWKMRADGSQLSRPGNNSTSDQPVVTADGWVYFAGTNYHLLRMFSDGSQQIRVDGNSTSCTPVVAAMSVAYGEVGGEVGGWAGEWVYWRGTNSELLRDFVPAKAEGTETGTPAYYVLTVAYSPPGTEGGGSASSVDYSAGSSTGTTTTTSKSFKAGTEVGASAGKKVELGGSFSASSTETNTSSLAITKNKDYSFTMSGPPENGINHDDDLFELLLNPTVTATKYPQDVVLWGMGVEKDPAMIYRVYAGWLNGSEPMPDGTKAVLDARGLTQDDYDQILSTNPFAKGPAAIDPERFLLIPRSFPYTPPFRPEGEPSKTTYTLSSSEVQTNTREVQSEYTVGMKVGIKFLENSNELTWTSTNSEERSSAQSQSASVTVGGPAYGYNGPTTILVYWDTLYSSYMFAFPTTSASLTGMLHDESGQPAAYESVTLTLDDYQFSTFTDGLGEYRFYDTPAGQGTISFGDRQIQVEVAAPE